MKQRVFGLDLLRSAAIIMVLISHAAWIIPNGNKILLDVMSVFGLLGVEFFFVLSGFLIGRILCHLYTSNTFTISNIMYFWIRRWFRTLPNYYLVLAINILIAFYIGVQLPASLWQYAFFIQNFSQEMPQFFLESWSLSIEEFAYLMGPIVLYLSLFFKKRRTKPQLFLRTTLFIIVLFTISKIVYNYNNNGTDLVHWNTHLKAVVIYRVDAVFYGVLAAFLAVFRPKFWRKIKYVWFPLGVILFLSWNTLFFLGTFTMEAYPFVWNVLYLPVNSITILLMLPLLSQMQTAPKIILKPITFISVISYAMYLLHYSVILQLLKYFFPTNTLSVLETGIYIAVYFVTTIFISFLLYRFFEKPITDIRDSKVVKTKFLKV